MTSLRPVLEPCCYSTDSTGADLMGLVGLVGHDPGCSICRTPLYPDISPNREWVAPRQCWMINRSARANIHTIDVSTKKQPSPRLEHQPRARLEFCRRAVACLLRYGPTEGRAIVSSGMVWHSEIFHLAEASSPGIRDLRRESGGKVGQSPGSIPPPHPLSPFSPDMSNVRHRWYPRGHHYLPSITG
jgi:hypothetical protein